MDWNTCYENKETPWDKGQPTPVLAELMARHPSLLQGRVLVPGCGLGHDALALSQAGCEVTGADIAALAIEKAIELDVARLVTYRLVDIFDSPADMIGAFDAIWEHTCLCALDPAWRNQYVAGIKTTLKPGGMVAGVFFINPEMDPGETGPPFGISVSELEALWQSVGFTVLDSWVPETGYAGRIGRELAMVLRLL
jgi:methyl halide transferase